MLRLLYTRHRGLGGLILLLLVTACLSVAVRPCLIAASLESSAPQSLAHGDHGGPRYSAPDPAGSADADHCPKAVCASLEAGQHQLSKHATLADAFQPLLLAAVFWTLPLALLLAPPRPLYSLSDRLPKLPPALRFRVLLI